MWISIHSTHINIKITVAIVHKYNNISLFPSFLPYLYIYGKSQVLLFKNKSKDV